MFVTKKIPAIQKLEHYLFSWKHVRVQSYDNFADSYQHSIWKYLDCLILITI